MLYGTLGEKKWKLEIHRESTGSFIVISGNPPEIHRQFFTKNPSRIYRPNQVFHHDPPRRFKGFQKRLLKVSTESFERCYLDNSLASCGCHRRKCISHTDFASLIPAILKIRKPWRDWGKHNPTMQQTNTNCNGPNQKSTENSLLDRCLAING